MRRRAVEHVAHLCGTWLDVLDAVDDVQLVLGRLSTVPLE
jgi:hypothetical protein